MPSCPVCDAADVGIQPDTLSEDLDQVDCPRCLRFQVVRDFVESLRRVRLDQTILPSLDSLSDYLRLRPAADEASITADNWLELAADGQRLRRELQPDVT